MCTHVPGECLAVAQGRPGPLNERLREWRLPGQWRIVPLVPEGTDTPTPRHERLFDHSLIHVTGIPDGLEVLAVSKLSAALNDLVGSHRAIVELNQNLPLGAQRARRRQGELSVHARSIAQRVRRSIEPRAPNDPDRRPIGMLDTGLALSAFAAPRPVVARDYVSGGGAFGRRVDEDHDLRGHGTRVARILVASLPEDVPLVSGRVAAADEQGITVMRVATAFAHLVASHDPLVVNVSLAPRDDHLVCPHCRRAVAVEAFHSLILPYVFRLVAPRTLTVMAAGNRGQVANARHALAETDGLTLVEATDSRGALAGDSNRVDNEYAQVAKAFGGDGERAVRSAGEALFDDEPALHGTSFAAGFVSAAIYAYRTRHGAARLFEPGLAPPLDFRHFCHRELRVPIDFTPAALPAQERIAVPAASP